MNNKLAITAIVMFAVVLGVSSIAPALAKADTTICHFAETEFETDPLTGDIINDPVTGLPIVLEEAHWMFKTLNSKGAANGHVGHHGPVDANGDPIPDANGNPLTDFIAADPAECEGLPTE